MLLGFRGMGADGEREEGQGEGGGLEVRGRIGELRVRRVG